MSKSNTKTFIEKSEKIHQYKYDYSEVVYVNQNTKVKIKCPTHGLFSQTPKQHIKGYGCIECGRCKMKEKNKKGFDDFVLKSNQIHDNKFIYIKDSYTIRTEKMIIECPIHGAFSQYPYNHLKGHGCPNCTYNNKTMDDFIKESKIVHGEKYDYNKVKMLSTKIKVIIICPEHGEFKQTPEHHTLRGYGCPICKESKGEKYIRNFLKNIHIKFDYQHMFKDCRNILPLPFDFYLPEYNVCIEFNGIQHYKSIDFFGGVEALNDLKCRDKIKINYCNHNDIKLFIIKYNDDLTHKLNKIKSYLGKT